MNRQYAALSGIAIALIALNHAIHFGLMVAPVGGSWLKFLIVLQALGAFAVPTFLFVSGAFLAYAGSELSFKFLRANLPRLLWPYACWSAIFYVTAFLINGESYRPLGYIKNLLVGYPYHFVPLLAFWYVSAPVLVRISRRYGPLLLVVIAAYQIVLIAIRFPDVFSLARPLPAWTHRITPPVLFTPLSDWAIYFPLGLFMSLPDSKVKPGLHRWKSLAIGTTAVLFGLGVLDAFKLMPAPWARFAAPVPLMFILPVVERNSIPLLRGFETLGRKSYGIYLAHFVIINLVVAAARPGLEAIRYPIVVFPVFYLLALGLSLVLMDVVSRTGPGRGAYRYVFGIMPPPRPTPRPQAGLNGLAQHTIQRPS